MENKPSSGSHSVVIEEKQKATVTGVEKVLAVKSDSVTLSTAMGTLTFTGKNFTISGYNEKDRTFSFGGEIASAAYQGQKEPFLKKIFK